MLVHLVENFSENSFYPSLVLISSDHQGQDLALKSPVITDKDGLRLFMSLKSCSKLDINEPKLLLFWLENDKLQT